MTNDKNDLRIQNDIRVDSNDKTQVAYLHARFPGKTQREVLDAIKKAGPMRSAIIEYLRNNDGGI